MNHLVTTIQERIILLLNHLNIEQAHFAARMPADWRELALHHPERISSLTLVAPSFIRPEDLRVLGSRLTVFSSDLPLHGDWVTNAMADLPRAAHQLLNGYETPLWADLAADHSQKIGEALAHKIRDEDSGQYQFAEQQGEVAGLTYRIVGRGAPLVLLPLGLAPSAWRPLRNWLAERCCVIELGGPELGILPLLEKRGQSMGYTSMLRELFGRMDLQPGQTVLEIGCGTGVVDRWLARYTIGQNPITGVDLNDYLLDEAGALIAKEGLHEVISFRNENAEHLSLADNSFDVVFSTTVMEEVNADRMLAEMIRVVKPAGHVGVIVRGIDLPYILNIPLSEEERAIFERQQRRPEGESCATASLYRRFQESVLTDISFGPQLATFFNAYGVVERFVLGGTLAQMPAEQAMRWEKALQSAHEAGTFLLAWPHHLAVGRKAG